MAVELFPSADCLPNLPSERPFHILEQPHGVKGFSVLHASLGLFSDASEDAPQWGKETISTSWLGRHQTITCVREMEPQ